MSILILPDDNLFGGAKKLSKNVFTIDEFLAKEIDKGNIAAHHFITEKRNIKLHGHCQQKALSSVAPTIKILSLPENYTVQTIRSEACCGNNGACSFGYEIEH